jgi:dihydrodipicolinate synthase/N-acetylneuraminate lyase
MQSNCFSFRVACGSLDIILHVILYGCETWVSQIKAVISKLYTTAFCQLNKNSIALQFSYRYV